MNQMQTAEKQRKKWSVVIGFLTILLFSIFGFLTSAAAEGNSIARWILMIIFGTIALFLASYVIGYIILVLVGATEEQLVPPKPTQKTKNRVRKQTRGKKRNRRKRNA
jgi:RsiW-degrading membrane proteinase PrsW (M82 family)